MAIRSCSSGFRLIPALVLAIGLSALPAFAARPRPDKVGGPESCAECHIQEIEVWKLSAHFRSFNEVHRRPEAAAILEKLGLGPMRQQQQCMDCHYLNRLVEQKLTPTSGVACESCHGAGQDWAQTHGDYGKGVKKDAESAEHRAARIAQSIDAGMVRADNLYALGSACYSCHLMNDEKIVNVGGHSVASPEFNFLTWSQGEVRHSMFSTNNQSNPEASPARRRQLYVLGVILETEYGFRAVARATEKAKFGVTLARQTDAARKLLEKIQGLAPTPELAAIVSVANATVPRLNHAAELNQAADRIAALGRDFAAKVTGEQLAAVDALVPDASHYRGKPYLLGAP
ncbi:MAG TPA: multiheme c-type cytochrome [Lacunisphaera sp.]|nr:multiheme c-type cytochrome [Lacunisphaera sp.]